MPLFYVNSVGIERFILEGALRKALANMKDAERELLIFVLQKDYGIRFGGRSRADGKGQSGSGEPEKASSVEEIEEALSSILGNEVGKDAATRFRSIIEQTSKYDQSTT